MPITLVMPFGLTNALAVFQALVNDVLRNSLKHFVFMYLNHIPIFSKTWVEHGEKYKFHLQTFPFLGFIVEQRQLKADPAQHKSSD